MAQGGEDVAFAENEKKGCCARFQARLRGFCHFLYNKEQGTCMGRHGKEWAQLIGFYLIFYAFLVAFWALCLYVFLQTTSVSIPKLLGYQSMLQLNPAMGYRPQPDHESNLIKIEIGNEKTYSPYVDDIKKFLAKYDEQKGLMACVEDRGVPDVSAAGETKACQFDWKKEAPDCNTPTYGFAEGNPCVLLKLNRIYGWVPPVKPNSTGNPKEVNVFQDILIQCTGENLPADAENMGQISYSPNTTINGVTYGRLRGQYFPFLNQPGYVSPFVFVRFPTITKNTAVMVWCQPFQDISGKFINVDRTEKQGGAHFELVVDVAPKKQV